MKKYILFFLFVITGCTYLFGQSDTKVFHGVVTSINGELLPFATVGIRGKNIGTVSNEDGSFSLQIASVNFKDSLCFSYAGYEDLYLPIDSLRKSSKEIRVHLNSVSLPEVVVVTGLQKIRKIGVKSRTPLLWGYAGKEKYFEMAQLIEITQQSKLLNIGFFLVAPKERNDSADVRINIYDVDNGLPGRRINTQNIMQRIAPQTGRTLISVEKYNMYFNHPIFIGVEILPDNIHSMRYNYSYGIRAGGKLYLRTATLGTWQESSGGTLTLSAEVKQ